MPIRTKEAATLVEELIAIPFLALSHQGEGCRPLSFDERGWGG
jgi:hypothetical protein